MEARRLVARGRYRRSAGKANSEGSSTDEDAATIPGEGQGRMVGVGVKRTLLDSELPSAKRFQSDANVLAGAPATCQCPGADPVRSVTVRRHT